MANNDHNSQKEHAHFILPTRLILKIGAALLGLTFVTVIVSHVDLGWWNFPVAMAVAIAKGSLVCLFFMGLKYDKKENAVILIGSVLFLAIFIVLTFSDLLFRPAGVYDKPAPFEGAAMAAPKFAKAWISTPQLVAHGKELFALQCTPCHGEKGEGNGLAAAGFVRKPRNFTSTDNWVNGRKPTQVFTTVTKGLNQMPSFASFPLDDRWAVVQYVLSLGPQPPQDTVADFAKAGIDPNTDTGGLVVPPSIPIDLAIELVAEDGRR